MENELSIPGRLNEGTLEQRMALRRIDMPPRYFKLVNWLIQNRLRAPFLTTRQVQAETGIMKHDVVNFAKNLGYSGWQELKEKLLAELTADLEDYHGNKRKREVALRIFRNAERKRKITQMGCPQCKYPAIFSVGRKWFFQTNSGESEPRIRFCPECGKKL